MCNCSKNVIDIVWVFHAPCMADGWECALVCPNLCKYVEPRREWMCMYMWFLIAGGSSIFHADRWERKEGYSCCVLSLFMLRKSGPLPYCLCTALLDFQEKLHVLFWGNCGNKSKRLLLFKEKEKLRILNHHIVINTRARKRVSKSKEWKGLTLNLGDLKMYQLKYFKTCRLERRKSYMPPDQCILSRDHTQTVSHCELIQDLGNHKMTK